MTDATMAFNDWLALGHDPSKPEQSNLYFIGTFDRRITFFSQQVRALRLADALSSSGKLSPTDNIAIVGGGIAGLTTAVAIALLGNHVTLYDPANQVIQLQSASSRFLHPHIYEWPRLGSLQNQAGLPILDWFANSGNNVCHKLQQAFAVAKARLPRLEFAASHRLKSLERVGAEWRIIIQSGSTEKPKIFQHVVLAMGFGEERSCGASSHTDYWKPTGVGTNAVEPASGATYLVSGNGDGGLTELLGLLMGNFDHVTFTRSFLEKFSGDALRDACARAFGENSNELDLEPGLRQHLLPILQERSILDQLSTDLRHDRKITFNSSGPHFERHKAAELNQCMAFAVLEAAKLAGVEVCKSSGHISDVTQIAHGKQVVGIQEDGKAVDTVFAEVILRHGPDRDVRYLGIGEHYSEYQTYMKALIAAHPELIEPPSLDPAIYERFEALAIDQLHDDVHKPELLAQVEQRQTTISIEIDEATGVLTEKGKRKLAEIAEICERLHDFVTISISADPSSVPCADDLVRLSRASGRRILLKADPSVYAKWAALDSTISQTNVSYCVYPATTLPSLDISSWVDACLMRLLDGRLQSTISSGSCTALGAISAELLAGIAATWTLWKQTLDAQPTLRKSVLRWLANVDSLASASWNGDHASLDDLASAIVLMVATHLAEPMTPAAPARGNLTFSGDALALGSGCRTINGRPIADWTQPEQWGVDALIVSTTAEIMISNTPAGSLIDGGLSGKGLLRARRVSPAVVQNSRLWRDGLAGSLSMWNLQIAKEFTAFRSRQDAAIKEVSE